MQKRSKMFVNALIGFVAVVALFLVVAALQPSEFKISRSISIAAPPEVVFSEVNDFHKMNGWSPWLDPDPTAKLTYEGPSSGIGASFSWEGNAKVGAGRLTITESHPDSLVRINMEFLKPLKNTSMADFTLQGDKDHTLVTWSMYGKRPFLGKVVGLLVNMDKMVGGNFEKGLAKLKTISETTAAK
jgi:hypothetical protein